MVFVILNWIYVFATTFLCGYAFAKLVEKLFGYQLETITGLLFCGLIIVTVYAQCFSLFCGVGTAANVVLVLTCAVVFMRWKKEITGVIYRRWKEYPAAHKITCAILIIIWCYCTSRGYMHYDSDLYHAQSIRWIEEYGIVKGLGNIHVRFAYNSSFFALSALYSMRNAMGQSLHTVNGFIALLLSIESLALFTAHSAKKVRLSDFARIGAIYYLTLIYRDIVSPASDYCVMCVVFYIIIRWLSYLESDEKDVTPYALLCVAGVYSVTLKLTAGVILLLLIKPAYQLLKGKRYRQIAVCIFMGTLVIVPWIIRTSLISGYLLYPFPALDVLGVDWKIDAAAAVLDAAEIKTWGRGLNNAALVSLPVREWFPQWFQNTLPMLGKLFILADMACIVIFVGFVIKFLVCVKRGKVSPGMADRLLVAATVAISYLFWQLSAPLLRYGYAYVLLLIVLMAGLLYRIMNGNRRILQGVAMLLVAVKMISFAGYAVSVLEKPYYVRQQDYGSYDLGSFTVGETIFYYPKSGDRTGYAYFPAVPAKTGIAFRGDGIDDGFRSMEKETKK